MISPSYSVTAAVPGLVRTLAGSVFRKLSGVFSRAAGRRSSSCRTDRLTDDFGPTLLRAPFRGCFGAFQGVVGRFVQ